jgi:low affinity Fe/Cu permease
MIMCQFTGSQFRHFRETFYVTLESVISVSTAVQQSACKLLHQLCYRKTKAIQGRLDCCIVHGTHIDFMRLHNDIFLLFRYFHFIYPSMMYITCWVIFVCQIDNSADEVRLFDKHLQNQLFVK